MLSVLLAATLAAAPKVALHVSTALKVSAAKQDEAFSLLERGLRGRGLDVHATGRECQGALPCLTELAQREGYDAIVLITLGPAGSATAVDLDAVRVRDQLHPALATFRFDSRAPAKAEQAVADFAEQLSRALPQPVTENPKPVTLTPDPKPVEAPVTQVASSPPRKSGPLLVGAAAVVAGLVSVGFGLGGFATQKHAESSPDGVHAAYLQRDVVDSVARANTYYSVSFAGAVLTGALLVAALVWSLSL